MPNPPSLRLSVVIVTFNEREPISHTIPALVAQLAPGDELIVSDNASTDGTPDLVRELAPQANVVQNGGNLGFAAACNSGAAAATGDLLLLLNPDAVPAPGFVEAIKRPLLDGRGWAAWMGLMTSKHGQLINCAGGELHFTGVAWAGGHDLPIETAPTAAREVEWVSGGCFAIPLVEWRRHDGFPPEFFIYQEDVDLSMRLRLEGGHMGIEPAAVVEHDYEFMKSKVKWRRLERNRWKMILRTYPGPLLALLAPALLVTELALLGISVIGLWIHQKLAAYWDILRSFPRLLRERRAIQAERRISAAEFASWMTPELPSPNLGRTRRIAPVRWALRGYWRIVQLFLKPPSH